MPPSCRNYLSRAQAASKRKARAIAARSLPSSLRAKIDRSAILQRLLRLTSWSFVAFAVDKSAMMIVTILVAKSIGAEDFGRLVLAQGTIGTFQIVILLGSGAVLSRYVPMYMLESMQRAVQVINMCLLAVALTASVAALIAVTWAPQIAVGVFGSRSGSPLPYLVLSWIIAASVSAMMLNITLALERGSDLAKASATTALLTVTAVPICAHIWGAVGAVAGFFIAELVRAAIFTGLYVGRLRAAGVNVTSMPRRGDIRLLVDFGLPTFLHAALWSGTMWLAQLLLKLLDRDGLAAVGVFGFANSVMGAVMMLSAMTNRASFPVLASLHADGDFVSVNRVTRSLFITQICAATAVAIPLSAAAPWIMKRLGPSFQNDWPVLLLMIGTAVIVSGQNALSDYLLVWKRPYLLLTTQVIWSIIVLGITFLFVGHGAISLAFALLLATSFRAFLIGAAALGTARRA